MPVAGSILHVRRVVRVYHLLRRPCQDVLHVSPRKSRVGFEHEGNNTGHDGARKGRSDSRADAFAAQAAHHVIGGVFAVAARRGDEQRRAGRGVGRVRSVFAHGTHGNHKASVGVGLHVGVVAESEGVARGEGVNDALAIAAVRDAALDGPSLPVLQDVVQAVATENQVEEVEAAVRVLLVVARAVPLDGGLASRRDDGEVAADTTRVDVSAWGIEGERTRRILRHQLAALGPPPTAVHAVGVLRDVVLVLEDAPVVQSAEDVAGLERHAGGDPHAACAVVPRGADDGRHARPVRCQPARRRVLALVLRVFRRPRLEGGARVVGVEAAGELHAGAVNAVVVDADAHAGAEVAHLPDFLHADHLVHPRLSTVGRVGEEVRGVGARLGLEVSGRCAVCELAGYDVLVGVEARRVARAVEALVLEAGVAVAVELTAFVAVEAVGTRSARRRVAFHVELGWTSVVHSVAPVVGGGPCHADAQGYGCQKRGTSARVQRAWSPPLSTTSSMPAKRRAWLVRCILSLRCHALRRAVRRRHKRQEKEGGSIHTRGIQCGTSATSQSPRL